MKTKTTSDNETNLGKYNVEYTDTFGGQANYSWVHRTQVTARNLKDAIKKAKNFVGLTGHRCRRVCAATDFGAALVPSHSCTILFVDYANN